MSANMAAHGQTIYDSMIRTLHFDNNLPMLRYCHVKHYFGIHNVLMQLCITLE